MSDFFAQPGRDARRKSDPLRVVQKSPAHAPDYHLYRVLTASDAAFNLASAPYNDESKGTNFAGYKYASFLVTPLLDAAQVGAENPTPGTASNPVVTVYYWNPHLKRFVPRSPTLTFAAVGAGIPVQFTVEADGKKILLGITGQSGSEVIAVHAAGFELDHER